MAWQIQQKRVTIVGGDSGHAASIDVVFPFPGARRIVQALSAISSFNIKFQDGDKHFSECGLDLDSRVESSGSVWAVRVTGTAGLRDSGGFDDKYDGHVTITVFADVES